MEAFVERNFQSLLTNKGLCDVAIDVGLNHEPRQTFHCVGALIAVHSDLLRQKICDSSIRQIFTKQVLQPLAQTSKSISPRESKEDEIIELSTDSDYVAEDSQIRGLEDLTDLDPPHQRTHHQSCHKRISLHDISCGTMEYLRLLFYGMNPKISTQNVVGICHFADIYRLSTLKKAALSYIECISIEEYPRQFLSLLLDSQRYELYSMINELILKLPDHNLQPFFSALINDDRFGRLSDAVIEMLLFQNVSFKAMPQELIFYAALKWAQSHDHNGSHNGHGPQSGIPSVSSTLTNVTRSNAHSIAHSEDTAIDSLSVNLSSNLIRHRCNDLEEDSLSESHLSPISPRWSSQSLCKLRVFLKYFDFNSMKHSFFREYVQNISGLLSKDQIIEIQEKHCEAMISSIRSMQNIIDLQRYSEMKEADHNLPTNHVNGHQLYKMDKLCHHSEALDLDLVHCINYGQSMVHEQAEYPAMDSYQFRALHQFIESNLKSLLDDDEVDFDQCDDVENDEKKEILDDHHDVEESEMTEMNLNVAAPTATTTSCSKHEVTNFYDVIFDVGTGSDEVQFHGIRALFAIHSPVFRSMLYGQMLEASSHRVRLHDMTPSIFKCLRACLYGFPPEITYQNCVYVMYSFLFYIDFVSIRVINHFHRIHFMLMMFQRTLLSFR